VEEIAMKSDWTRKKTILFLSRIHVKKGIELLMAAFAGIKEKLLGYTLVVAGEGEPNYIAHLKGLSEQLGIASQVEFPGGIYGESKWERYRNADVFVLPTYSENFGLVVAEALASGTPVMTTTGTPWQELQTLHCGWWVNPDVKALEKALNGFLHTSDGELEQMGRNGRKLIEEKYSSKKMAQDLLKLYRNILACKTNIISSKDVFK
jgi:glycosyltransferase involved in cell wall biosynthesis